MIGTRELPRPRRVELLTLAIAVMAAGAAGLLVAAAPLIGFAVVGAGVALAVILARPTRVPRLFIGALGVVIVAYLLGSRGIAYVGFGQVYIGEITLALGLLALLVALPTLRLGLFHVLLLAFIVLGAVQTLPYLGAYEILALRDGVVWGYALFAIAVAATFKAEWFPILVKAFRVLVPIMLVWYPIAAVLDVAAVGLIPAWPGAPVPIVYVKTGDAAVPLAATAAFVMTGLYASGPRLVRDGFVWALWLANVAIIGAISRGGMVAALIGAASSLWFVRSSARVVQAGVIALGFLVALYLVNPSVELGYAGRPVSFTQLVDNVISITSDDNRELEGTKAWRLAWWDEIVGYTVDGPYFWTGKGYGINLADDDGFQVEADGSLRSPHNGHLTILARGGVPMLVLWASIQAAFAVGLVRAAWRARATQPTLVAIIAVIFAYWIAALLCMTFDVYLEGPQGGIPFWSAIGLGMVAMRASRERPPEPELEPEPATREGSTLAAPTGAA